MEKMIQIAMLSIGGVFGVNARYWFGVWVTRKVSLQFPLATFLINVSGSFAIGFLTTLLIHWLPHPHFRLLVVTGFLGGYTTYSSFAFESLTLWERGEKTISLAYVSLTLIVGFLAVSMGVQLARQGISFQNQRAIGSTSLSPSRANSPPTINLDPDLERESQS